jgi:hypothetical protein
MAFTRRYVRGSMIQRGAISFGQSGYSVVENAGPLAITVRRQGGSYGEASCTFTTVDATAEDGTDYTEVVRELRWADGDASDRVVSVPITDRETAGFDRQFILQLNGVTGAAGGVTQVFGTILDSPPVGGMKEDSFTVGEDTALASHTSDVGGGWAQAEVAQFTVEASTNSVRVPDTGLYDAVGNENPGLADYEVEITGTLGATVTNDARFAVWVGRNNGNYTASTGYRFLISGFGWALARANNGVFSGLASDGTFVSVNSIGSSTVLKLKLRRQVIDSNTVRLNAWITIGAGSPIHVVNNLNDTSADRVTAAGNVGIHLRGANGRISNLAGSFSFADVPVEPTGVILNLDFSTGDLSQWPKPWNLSEPNWRVPLYGLPVQYGGDGSLMELVQEPTRPSSPYSLRVRAKNSVNGSETNGKDCDQHIADPCTARRSQMNGSHVHVIEQALPQFSERWITFSVYLPANWQQGCSSGFIVLLGTKGTDDGGSGMMQVHLDGPDNSWELWHRWSDTSRSSSTWQHGMFYNKSYPVLNVSPLWNDGVQDFPDPAASYAALASVNLGGWTDWLLHVKYDWRGPAAGGTGYMEFYKRENQGTAVKVLDVRPRLNNRGGISWDMGIGFNSEYFWISGLGLNMTKCRAWDAPNNLEAYFTNCRILDGAMSLESVLATL